jgi:hypothetical protein
VEDGEKNVNEENEIEPKCGEEWGKNTRESKGGERKKIRILGSREEENEKGRKKLEEVRDREEWKRSSWNT